MLDLSLFRKPAFNGVSAVAFCLSASMFALFLYITIYIQGSLGYSPLEAGLRFLPLTLLSFAVAPIAGALSNRIQLRVLMGTGLTAVGVGLLLMRGVSADSEWTTLLAGFLVAGAGIGLTNPGIGQAAIAVVPPARAGMALGDQHDLPPGRDRNRRRRVSGRSSSRGSTPSSASCFRTLPPG